MKPVAFLSTDNVEAFVIDDEICYPAFRELGWEVERVSWRDPSPRWERFPAVVIRTPWDYQNDPDAFLAVLEEIDRSPARLANPFSVVRWNLQKTYLRDLAAKGVPIVPTVWGDRLTGERLEGIFRELGAKEIVIKPSVSANADFTYRLTGAGDPEPVLAAFAARAFLAQPFLRSVVSEGEYSLFYFGGEHSHTILKTPRSGDFRVQEEHGGIIRAVAAPEGLVEAGRFLLDAAAGEPLYARPDFARLEDGRLALMELELIEPSLYFRMDAGAAGRFARAFRDWMER